MICLGIVLFLISCDWDHELAKTFDYNLRGTWVSNDPGIYSGKLIISYNTIIIENYSVSQGSRYPDADRPFHGFPKRVELSGYSEEGKLHIKYAGVFQDGISYIYEDLGWNRSKLLYITFGSRTEILQNSDE